MSDEDRAIKKELLEHYRTTTHWTHTNLFTHGSATITVDGKEVRDSLERDKSITKADLTDTLLMLAGAIPY
jgi:adenylylsulfate kinase-like enzyme